LTDFPPALYYAGMARQGSLISPEEFSAEIAAGMFKPAYYFFGTEDYRIVEAEKFLAEQFLPDRQRTTNYRRLDGRKTGCAAVLAELAAYPMLGERQVIAVSDFQSFKPTEIDRILGMLEPPDPNRIVVFSSPSARMPKRNSALVSKVTKAATGVEFKRLTSRETAATISRKLSRHDVQIDSDALTALVELIAGNRGALEAEVDKLISYKEAGEQITLDDVRQVSTGFQVFSVFTLAEEIISGNAERVLKQVRRLLADGNSPTGILFFVGQHFVSLYLVKNGKPLEPHRRFLASRFRDQALKFDNDRLEHIIQDIAETDASLRRGGIKAEAQLEALVLKLLRQSG
jgi:DNA polymerase-3 subunit delta